MPAALSLAWVAVALFGLFAMHGLGDHGTMHDMGGGVAPMSVGHHDHTSGQTTSVTLADVPRALLPDEPGMDGMGLAGLCVVVLISGVATLLVAIGLRRHAWMERLSAPSPGRRWPATLRDRDPPSLITLSIQRC